MVTINNIKFLHALGFLSVSFLMLTLLIALVPSVFLSAPAEAESVNATINTRLAPVVAIALQDNHINLNIIPKSEGVFTSGKTQVSVDTNNTTGYKLYLSTADGTTSLTKTDDATKKIDSISANNLGSADFGKNVWGYNLTQGATSGDKFNAIPASEQMVHTTNSANLDTADTFTLSFGVRADSSLPAGTYNNQMVISAVANPLKIENLSDLVYMQDMTPEICAKTPLSADSKHPVTKRLIDVRDGNSYWVSKLADGRCWMVQNLALDITSTMIAQNSLNSTNTDLNSGVVWGINSANSTTDGTDKCGNLNGTEVPNPECEVIDGKAHYRPEATIMINAENTLGNYKQYDTHSETYSWNMGKFVNQYPLAGLRCGDNALDMQTCIDGADNKSAGYKPNTFIDVSGPEWKPTWDYASTGTTLNAATHEYDAHYLIGNYYQYNTATAGSGGTISAYREAEDSICPKNWRLPANLRMINTPELVDYSFTTLLSKYGFTWPELSSTNNDPYGPNPSASGQDFRLTPLYFTTAGVVYYDHLRNVGAASSYWTATSDLNTTFSSGVNGDKIMPANISFRHWGSAVRCVAR